MPGLTMQAVRYSAAGSAREVLELVRLPVPEPGPGELRVRIVASGVNPSDCKARVSGRGLSSGPRVPHQDGAGIVDAVGEGVDAGRIGERVWVYHAAHERPVGTAAARTCLPADQAVRLPDGIDMVTGAGLGIPAITAHRCLIPDGVPHGRTVLVTGGAGAVGAAAIRIARWGGSKVVATVSSNEKADIARSLGAHATIDYLREDLAERLAEIAPEGVDVVCDVHVGSNLARYLPALADLARIGAYARAGDDPVLALTPFMRHNLTLTGVWVYGLRPDQLSAATRDITSALSATTWHPYPTHLFSLDEAAAAHEAVEAGILGKVVVVVDEESLDA